MATSLPPFNSYYSGLLNNARPLLINNGLVGGVCLFVV